MKLHPRNWGELVENVPAANEYHGMAGNFMKYAGPLKWNDMPVDSHELIGLCVPRSVLISAGAIDGDGWVHEKACFWPVSGLALCTSSCERRDLGTAEFPPI